MAKEWTTKCKDCGEEFGYSDYSYQYGNERGQSRPERCPTCRKIHNRLTGVMGFAYFELKPRAGADISQIRAGSLGQLSHPTRPHSAVEHKSSFDPSKFGVSDTDIRKLFDWFADATHQVAVVVGPTGSGKSTALPYRLIHPPDGIPDDFFTRHGQVLVTQPRIQATRNIPAYVAKDLYGSSMGAGFDIGFRYKNHPYSDWRNRLVYATDGTLINWLVNGQIANLSLIMIDEAHERTLNIDLILGLLKKLLPRYPHLRLIVASATINSGLFFDYFGSDTASLIEFSGMRKFNVETVFADESDALPYDQVPRLLKNIPDWLSEKVIWLLEEIETGNKTAGDILGFLQGEKPIEQAVSVIRKAIKANRKLANVDVFPLYTTLPQEEQNRALLAKPDPSRRRVVITTNVAETSLTVEGVVYVVDSGLINEAQWNPASQTKQVVAVRHSQAGCKQRWGRAGRVADGEAYCLYTKTQFEDPEMFKPFTVPQIQRSDLEAVVLAAKAAGVDDLSTFDWIQRPPQEELDRAPKALAQIGALDAAGDLTDHGLELQSFGEEPALANLMAMADQFACAIEIATLLPMMKLGGIRYLLKNDKKWDVVTRRAVNRLHSSLMAGCKDDVDFLLKLYAAWSEPEWDGQPLAPAWAIGREWPQRVPQAPADLQAALGDRFEDLKNYVLSARSAKDLERIEEIFDLGDVGQDWLSSVAGNFLNAERAAWGRAFLVNHSIFREKIEPERNQLLDGLSGHKKEVERRAIDFTRLDRVRLLMAACLPNRTYIRSKNLPEVNTESESKVINGDDLEQNVPSYHRWLPSDIHVEAVVPPAVSFPVQINYDSVNYDQNLEAFVAGKQQMIVHPLVLGAKPEAVMHVSYLAAVKQEWLADIQQYRNSPLALGQFFARVSQPSLGQPHVLENEANVRLFLDQLFPIGSRWEYSSNTDQTEDEESELVKLIRQHRQLREVRETYRGDEPELFSTIEDFEDVENADLVDTVLTSHDRKRLVQNADEETLHAWQEMDSGKDDDTPYLLHADQLASGVLFAGDPLHQASNETNTHLLEWLAEYADWQLRRPVTAEFVETPIAEVVGYDFKGSRPAVLLEVVPAHEPFDVFISQLPADNKITLEVVGYDQRPGDFMISLITRAQNGGLEIILPPEDVTFSGRGSVIKDIPIGKLLSARLESCDLERERVYASLLPVVEEFREALFKRFSGPQGKYELEATVREAGPDRVYFTLDQSRPEDGLVLMASISGRGLHRGSSDAYAIGDKCCLRLQFQQRDSHAQLDEIP